MEMTASNSKQRPALGLVVVAAIALLVIGAALVAEGFFPPSFATDWARLAFMGIEIALGLYIIAVSVGLAARFEWARLSAIWVGALFSPFYVLRLLIVSESLVTKSRDFAFAETVPNFFLLCLGAVAISTLVVTTLTSRSGRAAFAHVTDRERTDWMGLTCLNVCIALSLVVMINYAANRYYTRWDVTRAAFYNLADRTKSVLQDIKQPVDVIVYGNFLLNEDDTSDLKEHIANLLSEFQRFTPHLRVEYVDPFRSPDRGNEVRALYSIPERNTVVFSVGTGESARRKYVQHAEIAAYQQVGQYFRLANFTAEGAFVTAVLNVLQEKQQKVYFLTGHGERDVDSADPFVGYSRAGVALRSENLLVGRLNLAFTPQIPDDCDLLIVAGPTSVLPDAEIRLLRDYMAKGGRMLVMLDGFTMQAMKGLLDDWNIKVGEDVIIHRNHPVDIRGFRTTRPAPFAQAVDYSDHPAVRQLAGFNTEFPLARSVGVLDAQSQRIRVTELARTKPLPDFWGEMNWQVEGERATYNEGVDIPGPLTIAVAAEASGEAGGNGRMIVIGSSFFLTNHHFTANNYNFFINTVNWLLSRPTMLGYAAKTPNEYAVRMKPEEIRRTKTIVVVIIPACIALLGLAMWFIRRK
jgi:ABC-type uncharacterized transport system involved in gliding motility auxiliary subunit